MAKTLGLDLGSNSLGWAVIDDVVNKITAQGVVIFPEGIEREKGNDTTKTPAAERREHRAARRLKFRRKMRKWKLLEILIREGMCPLTQDELTEWKARGKFPLENAAFINWLHATDTTNPYCDRARAAEEKVEPLTLGRALYHICQRRGFKSSRKDAAPDTGDENENKKVADKATGLVKSSIAELTRAINASGAKTLGQYFYRKLEEQKASSQKERVRAHYTGRIEHYEKEFAVIMGCQGIAPESPLYKELHSAIFMQRPLRSQRYLKGMCPLEPKSPRTFVGHPLFEEYRMWAFINNLEFERDEDGVGEGERMQLTAEDRALVATVFDRATSFKFKAINDLFKKDVRFKSRGWNTLGGWHFHYYKDAEVLPSCSVRHRLKKNFGGIAYDEQEVVNALMFYDDDEKLAGWFKKHYPALGDEAVAKLVKIRPSEVTTTYSLKAIKRILPFLRKGLKLYDAALLARMSDIVADFPEHEGEIELYMQELHFRIKEARKRADVTHEKVPVFMKEFEEYLLNNYGVTSDRFAELYTLSDCPYQVGKGGRIHAVQLGMIRNPLVQRSLTTLRRLVNYLHDHEVIDMNTTIRLEMAHSVNSYSTRQGWALWQKKRQEMRLKAKAELEAHNITANDDAIERYLLWDELPQHTCLYTGRTIKIGELFSGQWEIEHTIPRSKSGDDSFANKTICEARYNREIKKGKVPRDCPKYEEIEVRLRPWREKIEQLEKVWLAQKSKSTGNPEARAKALAVKFELDYWRDKLRRFEISSDKLADPEKGLSRFKNHQLVDTGVMTTHAIALLKSVYGKVYTVNGAATAFARKAWGLQSSDEVKDRTNHTHHAKDAMVIAALTPTRFNAICEVLKDDASSRVTLRECDVCPPPWKGFANDVRHATEAILVKHVLRRTTLKQSTKQTMLAKPHPSKKDPEKIVKYVNARGDTVRGQLHAETFYGCIQKPGEEKKAFVVRKPLEGKVPDLLKLSKDIVDPAIRNIVEESLKEFEALGQKVVVAGDIKMPSGVPIKKVRIYANQVKNPSELRQHAMPSRHDYKTPYYVTAAGGSNFRMGVYEVNGKRSVMPDNSLDWAQNHKKPDYETLDKRPGFLGFIYPGSLALTHTAGHPEELKILSQSELAKRLYKVVSFEETGRMILRLHTEARAGTVLSADLDQAGMNKRGEAKICFENPYKLLRLAPSIYLNQMLFEGIHFKMMFDGTIQFL